MRTRSILTVAAVLIGFGVFSTGATTAQAADSLADKYAGLLKQLQTELTAKIPPKDAPADAVAKYLTSDALDAKLAKFVVLHEATPAGLAAFAQ